MAILTGSANCIRYVLFAFNFAFVITGIILISVGANVSDSYKDYEPFLDNRFFSIPTFLIVIGVFIFVIAFFGCYGAYRENYCMIIIFSSLLTIIFIFELSAGIAGYVLRGDTVDLVSSTLTKSMAEYKTNRNIASMWDTLQNSFECCGTNKYDEWVDLLNPKNSTLSVPISCCRIPVGQIGKFTCDGIDVDLNLKITPCLHSFADYISQHAISLGAAGVVFAVIQLIGIVFSCYIGREIKTKHGISGMF